jgi:hypothetical protein
VTIFSRDAAALKNVPAGVEVKTVDYTSSESLVDALRGHDVVLSTLGFSSVPLQKSIIDAAVEAGVKRFIPSDFAGISTDPKAKDLPPYAPTTEILEYLKAKAESSGLEYTVFSIGAFLEFIIETPFFVDWKNHSAELFDDGAHAFSCTSVSGVGKAVAASLKKPEDTKNKNLFVHEVVLSQAKLLALAKKHTADEAWTETKLNAADELEKAKTKVEQEGITDPLVMLPLVKACLMSGKFAAAYAQVDNELLGLPLLSDEDLESQIAAKFA